MSHSLQICTEDPLKHNIEVTMSLINSQLVTCFQTLTKELISILLWLILLSLIN